MKDKKTESMNGRRRKICEWLKMKEDEWMI